MINLAIPLDQKDEDLEVIEAEPSEKKHGSRTTAGISKLDDYIEGGFRKGSSNLLVGGPGCGKTIMSMQFLVEGINKANEHGVYISLDQPEEKIVEDVARFDWNILDKIKKKQLIIVHYNPEQIEKVIEMGGGILRDTIESVAAKRIVIDSISAFSKLYQNEASERRALYILLDTLHKWGGTALMPVERQIESEYRAGAIDFMADSIILVANSKTSEQRKRSIEIIKMRGTKHSTAEIPIQITDKGVEVDGVA